MNSVASEFTSASIPISKPELVNIFVIKVLFICFCFSLTFHFTLGLFLTKLKKAFDYHLSKEQINVKADILRGEIKKIIKQDRIFSIEDTILIKQLIDKINFELSLKIGRAHV